MTAPAPFTSDLSVDELLVLDAAGWEPLEIVCGDCTYNPGRQASSPLRSKELNWVSDGLTKGQALAVQRMREQAAEAGADGVVGVRLSSTEDEVDGWGEPLHFTALGTAVRRRERPRGKRGEPFTSHLSGQDTWALTTAGRQPVGLVFGFSVYHARYEYKRLSDFSEMGALTEAFYSARELAMKRMQQQAKALSARGVVGVEVDMRITGGPTVRFSVLGTAITIAKDAPTLPEPRVGVSLNRRAF
jgi:uncharacterized protein YbjQ (UPF0145 family)